MAVTQTIAIVVLAAVADNGVIGANNAMPWRLRSDLQRFKAMTIGKPVVMGRKTYQSIGRALPGRTNIVITRNHDFAAAAVVAVADFGAALTVARGDALRRGVHEIAIIGGTDIFTQAMPLADRLEITHVHAHPEGDVLFPPIDPRVWRRTALIEQPAGTQDEASFAYATYERA